MTDTLPAPVSGAPVAPPPSAMRWPSRLPPWLNPLTPWTRANLATSAVLREAKALLYIELAEAAARGVPMDRALELCARTSGEMGRTSSLTGSPSGADTRPLPLALLAGFFSVVLLPVAGTLMAAAGMRFADTDRVARKLAIALRGAVAGGATLSAAMANHPREFDLTERRLVEAGERWDRLPAALKRLGEFQGAEARADRVQRLAFYPVWIAVILMAIGSFILMFILPKFKDIYDQLGAPLPAPTQMAVHAGYLLVGNVFGLFGSIALFLVLLGALVRCFMNGSGYSKSVFMMGAALIILISFLNALELFGSTDKARDGLGDMTNAMPWSVSGVLWYAMLWLAGGERIGALSGAVVFFFGFLFQFALAGWVLLAVEAIILRAERVVAGLAGRVPVIGAAAAARGEARWMGALALGLDRSGTTGEALRVAGGISGGWRGRASAEAARLADAGTPLGEAVGRAGAAAHATAARLTLMEGRPDFAGHLRDLADDRAAAAAETTERFTRIAESLSVLAVGVIAGTFVIAVYLPLFNIPKVVGLP